MKRLEKYKPACENRTVSNKRDGISEFWSNTIGEEAENLKSVQPCNFVPRQRPS